MANLTSRVCRNAKRRGVKIVSRTGWGNISPVYQWRKRFRRHAANPSDTLWAHISVTKRSSIRADARALHRIGMERFGSGISYNFAIDHITGEVALGQALDAKGTHTINDKGIKGYSHDQNLVSHAIVFIGMPGMKPSDKAIRAAGLLMAAMISEGALTRGHDFNPHSMVAAKDCPTDAVREAMPRIRRICNDALERKN